MAHEPSSQNLLHTDPERTTQLYSSFPFVDKKKCIALQNQMCEFLSCIYTSEFLLREKALKNKSSHPSRHTHAPWAFFPPTQVVTVVCSAACGCQEAHAISQFSSVSPLDHPTNPIHSLNQTRVRLLPPPLYLSNFVLEKHKLHLRVSRWSPTCNHPAGVPSICCFPSFISKFDFIPAKKKRKNFHPSFKTLNLFYINSSNS